MRDIEEWCIRLVMEEHVLLRRAAVRAVIREITGLAIRATESPEGGPREELSSQLLVHRPDIADGELDQRLVRDESILAIDADGFHTGTTLFAGNRRNGNVGLTRDNVESVVVFDG